MTELIDGIRSASCHRALVLANLWLDTEEELAEARRVKVKPPAEVDVAIVCVTSAGQRFSKTGLPVIGSCVADVLTHGPRFLTRLTSRSLVKMVRGGGRVFADSAAVICATTNHLSMELWDGRGASLLPKEMVADLKACENGVVQDAIQDLAQFCRGSDDARRAEVSYRLLRLANTAEAATVALVTAVLQNRQTVRPTVERYMRNSDLDPSRCLQVDTVSVPAGEFVMGSDASGRPAEQPQQQLWLPAFRIGRDPITRGQFVAFVEATDHPFPPKILMAWSTRPDQMELPADHLNYFDVLACCNWMTWGWRQLDWIGPNEVVAVPTEPEWEKAARGLDGRLYPWGDEFDPTRCNSKPGGPDGLTPVGRYSPFGDSPYGARDMAGNVFEWTSSLWGTGNRSPRFGYPYDPTDGRESDTLSIRMRRVIRGGAYYYQSTCVACFVRNHKAPDLRQTGAGFRIVIRNIGLAT